MKKLTIIPVALLACAAAYGQGTVGLNNNTATKVTASTGVSATAANGFEVDLLYQANNGGAAPAALTGTAPALGNWLSAGVFAFQGAPGQYQIGTVALPGIAFGANVWLETLAWNNSSPTLAAALAGGPTELFGNSPVVTVVTPANSSIAPNTIGNAAGFSGFTASPLVPEPTTLALGALGAASLLAFRRRK
jgi:hypothetical protein